MELATHTLSIVHPQPADLWPRLRGELDAQGSPPIGFERRDGTVTFSSDTRDFMLRARVADALMEVCGHGEWTRAFQPLDSRQRPVC